MEYVALIHADEGAWEQLSEEGRSEMYAAYGELVEDARQAGVLVMGDELEVTGLATTVRVRNGETLVSDGPYAEVKEALGGFFVFDCASFDEAVEWAARIPSATHGAIEVRPVHVDAEEGS